ncbi:hypothetical protein [Alkalimarinus coralli]|uniref:hypothetical protein n=1 Tax=Alkalimarinus coralli TaxID=2935863 RepID=UPI00202B06F3|nr:hypothetical protein [Alkalimarinus coralli]
MILCSLDAAKRNQGFVFNCGHLLDSSRASFHHGYEVLTVGIAFVALMQRSGIRVLCSMVTISLIPVVPPFITATKCLQLGIAFVALMQRSGIRVLCLMVTTSLIPVVPPFITATDAGIDAPLLLFLTG